MLDIFRLFLYNKGILFEQSRSSKMSDEIVSKSLILFSDAMKPGSNRDHAIRVTSWTHYKDDNGRGYAESRRYRDITPSSINRLNDLVKQFNPLIQIIDSKTGDQFISVQVTSNKRR